MGLISRVSSRTYREIKYILLNGNLGMYFTFNTDGQFEEIEKRNYDTENVIVVKMPNFDPNMIIELCTIVGSKQSLQIITYDSIFCVHYKLHSALQNGGQWGAIATAEIVCDRTFKILSSANDALSFSLFESKEQSWAVSSLHHVKNILKQSSQSLWTNAR